MRVVTLARKPVGSALVAATEHRTGMLQVDACRIDYRGKTLEEVRNEAGNPGVQGGYSPTHQYGDLGTRGTPVQFDARGRWPANLVLQHLLGCTRVGVKRVKAASPKDHWKVKGTPKLGVAFAARHPSEAVLNQNHSSGYGDEDGLETVEAWECSLGCPVADLDAQSGTLRARGNVTPTKAGTSGMFWGERGGGETPVDGGDVGGASRFYKVVR